MRVYPEGSEKKASPRLLAKMSFLKANFSGFAETLKHGREKGREREKNNNLKLLHRSSRISLVVSLFRSDFLVP